MSTYKLGVVAIPTNRPMVRKDKSDLIYRDEDAKYRQVVADIVARHARRSARVGGNHQCGKERKLSGMLAKNGVRHEVLNAKKPRPGGQHHRRGWPKKDR